MPDFNLSGLPIGHDGEFPLEAKQQLTGSFSSQFVIGDGQGSELLSSAAAVTGLVTPTIVGTVTGTSNLAVQGGVLLDARITGDEAVIASLGSFETGFIHNDGVNDFALWAPSSISAEASLSGTFLLGTTVGGEIVAIATLTGSPKVDQFIGLGDVAGNELLSALGTLTGQPDPLKDGGSPPFVIFNGTDQYISHPVTSISALRGGANFSCVVVFDPELVENAGTGVLVGKHDTGSTEWGWRILWDNTTGEITVLVSSSDTGANRAERTTAVGGPGIRVRTVFVFTWDSTALELYVAGASSQDVQNDFGTPGAMVQGDAIFAIGADEIGSTPADFYRGAVHAVYIFDDVLSSGEVGTIDQSGYLPFALEDSNLLVEWRPDRIEGQTVGFNLTKWLDDAGFLQLDRSSSSILCFPGIVDHLRFRADDWNMDFLNAEIVGVSLDQNLVSNYGLSVSSTNFVENGGFRLFVPVSAENEPEIVSGFRTNANDITIVWGGRKDETSASDVIWLELLAHGIQIFFDASTLDLFVFHDTGTTTRFEYGQSIPGMETTVPDGPGTVFALRYNSQTALFTLFVNGTKLFETGTTVTGPNLTGSGFRMCEFADWATVNGSAGQADRRGAFVFCSALPDILMEQVLSGISPIVVGLDNAAPIGRTLRAALRRNAVPSLPFGLSFFEYDAVDAADDDPPTPFPDRLRPYASGSGTVEIEGQPLDGEQFQISDGTTTLTFEIEISGGITGDVSVNLGAGVLGTLTNIQTAINASALNITASAPVVFQPDGLNDVGFVRLTQDDLHDGDLPLIRVLTEATIPGGRVRATGLYRVLGPVGTVELADGQPNDADEFMLADGTSSVSFEFESGGGVGAGNTAVTIGADIQATMGNLVTAINASILTITADPTVTLTRFSPTIDAVFSVLTHTQSADPFDYPNRTGIPIVIVTNASGNLRSSGMAQPTPFEESAPQLSIPVHSLVSSALTEPFVDNPYAVLEAEGEGPPGGGLPPFINPNPLIISVTADIAHNVTAVANAGPTDAGDVRSWWEIELVSGDPQFNLRIDEQDNNFSINKNHIDLFPVPLGQNWEDLRIRFVIQSQLDPDQLWFSLYVRMDSENFDNGEVVTIILPGTGAPEPPPTIELEISLEAQAFVVQEAEARAARQLALSNRSRYKLTGIFINTELDPRVDDRNEDGLEFGLLSVLDDFLELGTQVRTHIVAAGDIGFLDRIATRFYGAGFEDFWWAIAYANGIVDPDAEMFTGQNLIIPSREAITAFLARKPTAGVS